MNRLLLWKLAILAVTLTLLAAACGPLSPSNVTVTPTLASPTPTPSQTPLPTSTPLPPSPIATVAPVEGTVTAQINVRSGPGTTFDSLGLLNTGQQVQILVQSADGKWYQVLYPVAPQGRGWVAAQYVTVAAGAEIPPDATPTPSAPSGRVTQRLNVRSGPGMTFNSLGMLEPETVVTLTGKNATASWFQIEYAAGPGGRGWVTVQYVHTEAAADLPMLDDNGNLLTPAADGTPSGQVVTPTPTVGPASADYDSSSASAIQVTFSPFGTRQFSYTSDVSSPQGDAEDWVAFTPYASLTGSPASLLLSLICAGNGNLEVELWQNSALLNDWGGLAPAVRGLACGDQDKLLELIAGIPYHLRLRAAPGDGLRYVHYTLTVFNIP